MSFQANATFKENFERLTQPYQKVIPQFLAKQSDVLSWLFRPIAENQDGKPINGLPTFKGRYVKPAINANYNLTVDKVSKYNIQMNDTKVLEKGRNLIYAEIEAVDKAFTMGITKEDMQRLAQYGNNSAPYINWIEDYWKKEMRGMASAITYSIYNGLGASATRWDGEVRPDFYGLSTIIGTGAYGGKTTADWGEWKGQLFDLNDATTLAKLGLASADIDTIDEFIAVPTGKKTSRFYNMLNMIQKIVTRQSDGDKIVVMNPITYDNLWLPCLEANTIGYASRFSASGDDASEVRSNVNKLDRIEILVEDTRIPTTAIGASSEYVISTGDIYILTKDALHLEVEESNNFVVSPWTDIPNVYGSMQKSVMATLLFYATSRFNLGKITLPTAVKTELDSRSFL